jgi:hypothetical protein
MSDFSGFPFANGQRVTQLSTGWHGTVAGMMVNTNTGTQTILVALDPVSIPRHTAIPSYGMSANEQFTIGPCPVSDFLAGG